MSAKYPRLAEWKRPKPNSGRVCRLCGAKPAGLIFIQVSWFRGEDEIIATCDLCKKTRKNELLNLFLRGAKKVNHELTIKVTSDIGIEGTCSCGHWLQRTLTKTPGMMITQEQAEAALRETHKQHVGFAAVTKDLARDKGR